MVSLSQSPLLQAIQNAIINQKNNNAGIRISITKAPLKLNNASTGEFAWMKALCWNLLDEQGGYLTDPVLAVVRGALTETAIEADLHALFPGRKAIVDNDIYVDDDDVSNFTKELPHAVDPAKVGTYPARTLSGGGYFYDEVLEYRVWVYSEQEGEYHRTFVDYKSALAFAIRTLGAKDPNVLILQKEYVDEPTAGVFTKITAERIAEWRVEWLEDSKREENNIDKFIEEQGGV
jgi:putative acetyltransferase